MTTIFFSYALLYNLTFHLRPLFIVRVRGGKEMGSENVTVKIYRKQNTMIYSITIYLFIDLESCLFYLYLKKLFKLFQTRGIEYNIY